MQANVAFMTACLQSAGAMPDERKQTIRCIADWLVCLACWCVLCAAVSKPDGWNLHACTNKFDLIPEVSKLWMIPEHEQGFLLHQKCPCRGMEHAARSCRNVPTSRPIDKTMRVEVTAWG